MIEAIPHTVERATMSNINSVAKSIAIFFIYPFFIPNLLRSSCYPYLNTILFTALFQEAIACISYFWCKGTNCARTQQIFMQLYSVFTHSFDLSQVIDFKQVASILPNDKQKRKNIKVYIVNGIIEHKNLYGDKFPKKP